MSSNSGSTVSRAAGDDADPAGIAGANEYDLLAPEPAKLTGALIGHARVSTSGQILDGQTRTHHPQTTRSPQNFKTTPGYADHFGRAADDELRAWHRRRQR